MWSKNCEWRVAIDGILPVITAFKMDLTVSVKCKIMELTGAKRREWRNGKTARSCYMLFERLFPHSLPSTSETICKNHCCSSKNSDLDEIWVDSTFHKMEGRSADDGNIRCESLEVSKPSTEWGFDHHLVPLRPCRRVEYPVIFGHQKKQKMVLNHWMWSFQILRHPHMMDPWCDPNQTKFGALRSKKTNLKLQLKRLEHLEIRKFIFQILQASELSVEISDQILTLPSRTSGVFSSVSVTPSGSRAIWESSALRDGAWGCHPSEKLWLRQVGWWNSTHIWMGKCQIHGNHSPPTRKVSKCVVFFCENLKARFMVPSHAIWIT